MQSVKIERDFIFLIIIVLQCCLTMLVRSFFTKQTEVMLFEEYLMSLENPLTGIPKIVLVAIIIYFYLVKIRQDCQNFFVSLQENMLITVAMVIWFLLYATLLMFPVRSTYIAISYLCFRQNLLLFFEKLLLDTFLDVFLFVYLLFYKINGGKSIERIIRARNMRMSFYIQFLLAGVALLMTATHYYSEFDSSVALPVLYFMNSTLLLVCDVTNSVVFSYFLFVSGKMMATLLYPALIF
ncbi:putative transporter [Trachipleistophora hominis]|uniref:Putative transporter n=1 Tax=Trachipleistophora hominis TaxID=72359 RepID=L7JT54_TRAHO|nr:putative transporter [Trachipleistophora hominis]